MARRTAVLLQILVALAAVGACDDGRGPARTSSDVTGPPPVRPAVCVVPDDARPDAPRTHVVRAGETLRTIALLEYGDERFWTEIARANPASFVRGGAFRVGTILTLPANVR
jgi:nucleoid-associated protein YgaU